CRQPSAVGYAAGSKQQSVRGTLLQVVGSLRNKRKCRTICSVAACFRSLHHDGGCTSFESQIDVRHKLHLTYQRNARFVDFSCKRSRVAERKKDAERRMLQCVRQHMWGLAQRPGDESDAELF